MPNAGCYQWKGTARGSDCAPPPTFDLPVGGWWLTTIGADPIFVQNDGATIKGRVHLGDGKSYHSWELKAQREP